MPLGGLIPARSKTDYAKQLKEFFTVIETENDKERKSYEEVKSRILIRSGREEFVRLYLGNQKYSQGVISFERWSFRST